MNPEIKVQDDGSVKVTLGDRYGYVSSMHLVDTKVNQLKESVNLDTGLPPIVKRPFVSGDVVVHGNRVYTVTSTDNGDIHLSGHEGPDVIVDGESITLL